jgi:hypothetical protein
MKYFLCVLFLLPLWGHSQNEKSVDPVAISLVDKMGEIIGSLESCGFELRSVHDDVNQAGMMERKFEEHQIYFRGPNKMVIHSRGDKGNYGYWYNGSQLTWYSYDENNFVTIPAPATSLQTIDSVNAVFGLNFPAADIFYPSFADDLIDEFDRIEFAGIKSVEGTDCFHIIAENEDSNFQLWIENGAIYLPKKFLFLRKGKTPSIIEGTFTAWNTMVLLPDGTFEFSPPENATLISIMAKN